MEKQKVLSFEDIVSFVKNNSSDFSDFIELCRSVHELVFDYNTFSKLKIITKDDSDSSTATQKAQIDSEIEKIIETIKTSFDVKTLELTHKIVFNEIIMVLSKVEDK
jgi:hypothetical protein